MYGQTHAGLGWVIGAIAPSSDRRLRAWCTAAAVLPDFDAAAMLWGIDSYVRWHHKPGHNVFVGAICVILAMLHFRQRPWKQWVTAVVLVAICWASHILTDMKMSGWEVYLFWPFSERPSSFSPMWSLGHPVNTWLAYIFMTLPWVLALWRPVTPLELISPRLDRIFLNAFRKRTSSCGTCGRPCNQTCDRCGGATCMKDGNLDWRFRITCRPCALKK